MNSYWILQYSLPPQRKSGQCRWLPRNIRLLAKGAGRKRKAQRWAALHKTAHNQQLTAIIALMVLCICMCVCHCLGLCMHACVFVLFLNSCKCSFQEHSCRCSLIHDVIDTLNARIHFRLILKQNVLVLTRSHATFCLSTTSYSINKNILKGILFCEWAIPGIVQI